MNELLHAIYDHFYVPSKETKRHQEIESCHQALIETLSKDERRILLRIIDVKDQIAEIESVDSFIQGFLLASQLAAELSHYTVDLSVSRTRKGGRMR